MSINKPGVTISVTSATCLPVMSDMPEPDWSETPFFPTYRSWREEVKQRSDERKDLVIVFEVSEPTDARVESRLHLGVCVEFYLPRPNTPIGLFTCLHEFAHYLNGDVDKDPWVYSALANMSWEESQQHKKRIEIRASSQALKAMKNAGHYTHEVEQFAFKCLAGYGVKNPQESLSI